MVATTTTFVCCPERPMGIRGDVELTDDQLRRLWELDCYDMWFVRERLISKGLIEEEHVIAAEQGFKQYIALTLLGHTDLPVPSEQVDEVWHCFLLFTREYSELCRQIGSGFIHHVPRTSRTAPPEATQNVYELFDAYFSHPAVIGGDNSAALTCDGGGCQSCHNCHGCGVSTIPASGRHSAF